MKNSSVFLLVVALCLAGCSTERYARATQQTAIGGGFVAIGSLGLAGSAAGAAALAATAASSPDSTGVLQASLLSIGVSAGVSAAITGGGFLMMSMAEPDLVPGFAGESETPSKPDKARTKKAPLTSDSARTEPRRQRADGAVQTERYDFEPRNESHLTPISERLLLGLGHDSVIINLPQMAIVRGEHCGHVTITQAGRSATALVYEPIASSFRLGSEAIALTCDDFLPVMKACDSAFELSLKECRSMKSALERDK